MAEQEKIKITTIKLASETKERLDKLKEYRRESYDDLLKKILSILNLARNEPEKARMILNKIHKPLNAVEKYTKVYPQEKQEKSEKPKISFIKQRIQHK